MGDPIIQDIRDAFKWRFFCQMVELLADLYPTMRVLLPVIHYFQRVDSIHELKSSEIVNYIEQIDKGSGY